MNTYIVWDQYENIVIRDSVPKMYGRMSEFMLENYFKPNVVHIALEMQHETDINEQYLELINHVLRNECSLVAIDEKTNTIYAVALLKWMTEEWRSWINLLELLKSPKLVSLLHLWYLMFLKHRSEFPNHAFDSLHMFQYHIREELRNNEVFLGKFFNAINEVGRHMKMPRITYIATAKAKQQQMDNAGYTRLLDIIYALYITGNQRPFTKLREANEPVVVYYEKQLIPLIPYYEMPPFEPEPVKPVASAHVEPEKIIPDARRQSSL